VPRLQGPLLWLQDSQEFVCRARPARVPVRDGIPVMLPDEARRLSAEDSALERR
jgi:uncharacterized protein YbaR (Trm112 family)